LFEGDRPGLRIDGDESYGSSEELGERGLGSSIVAVVMS
jgi:hypothetical protein